MLLCLLGQTAESRPSTLFFASGPVGRKDGYVYVAENNVQFVGNQCKRNTPPRQSPAPAASTSGRASVSRCLPPFRSAIRPSYELRGATHPGSFRAFLAFLAFPAFRKFPCPSSLWAWASAEKSECLAQCTQWHTEHLAAGSEALFPPTRK